MGVRRQRCRKETKSKNTEETFLNLKNNFEFRWLSCFECRLLLPPICRRCLSVQCKKYSDSTPVDAHFFLYYTTLSRAPRSHTVQEIYHVHMEKEGKWETGREEEEDIRDKGEKDR